MTSPLRMCWKICAISSITGCVPPMIPCCMVPSPRLGGRAKRPGSNVAFRSKARFLICYVYSSGWLLEIRFSLLKKGLHPLLCIRELGRRCHHLHGVRVGLVLRKVYLRVVGLFAHTFGDETATRRRFEQALGLLHELFGWHHPVDQSPLSGRVCMNGIARQQHFQRPFAPNVAADSHHWRCAEPTTLPAWRCEGRVSGGNRQVARGHKLAPSGGGNRR